MSTLLIGSDSGVFRLTDDGAHLQEVGPPEASFFAVTAAKEAFAITRAGALWARTVGGAWHLRNERAVADEVWSFATEPGPDGRLYLGVSPALLHRSDDDGASWTACESVRSIPGYERWTFPPPPHVPHVRSIATDPTVAGAVYIGVEEGGVYRSGDGGDTWENLNDGLNWDVHTISPALDGSGLYATTGAGFHRSDDGGRHWRHVEQGLDRGYTVSLLVSRAQRHRVFVAAAAGPPPTWSRGADAAIYRSDNGGEHWTQLTDGLPSRFDTMVSAIVEDDAGRVYAAAGQELFASEGGSSWHLVARGLPKVRALATLE